MKTKILNETFGLKEFRPYQSEIIDAIFNQDNKGILTVMPTSSGKSLLYQLPSLISENLTIVISPLISLMKDQVDFLRSKGIAAEFYNSSLLESEKRQVEKKLINQSIKLLYVAPERFDDQNFKQAVQMTNKIGLFAVDESHCISSWGHDFRPSYRKLTDVIEFLKPQQIIALTATATKRVQKDICKQLNIPNAAKFVTGFYRPDLSLHVKRCTSDTKIQKIVRQIKAFRNMGKDTGIIYSPTRGFVDQIYNELQKEGITSSVYHAGLSDAAREQSQNNWFRNGGIIIATVAFGMGIDKPDVRFILHAGLPSSVENYYQEIGRASRDGKGAICCIYFDPFKDIGLQEFFIEMSYPPDDEIVTFWSWCCRVADNNKLITMTQKDMAERSGVKSHCVPGCISKLKENGLITTLGRGKYEIRNKNIFLNSTTFNFDQLNEQRQSRFDTLHEMSDFVNNNDDCRMLQILHYFDDYSRIKKCNKCDICIDRIKRTKPVEEK